jgi:hypothetical protein
MSTNFTNNTSNGLGNGPRYFRSFASYEIPFQPDEPVEKFAQTEGLKSFYRAFFDSENRVCRFDKLLMVRVEKEEHEIKLPVKGSPGAAVYFEVVRDPQTRKSSVGKRLTYLQTEKLEEFYVAEVDSSGQKCRAVLFARETAFSDTYNYWPSGCLRTRTTTKKDSPPVTLALQ